MSDDDLPAILCELADDHDWTYTDLAVKLRQLGHTTGPSTVKGWMAGIFPRNPAAIRDLDAILEADGRLIEAHRIARRSRPSRDATATITGPTGDVAQVNIHAEEGAEVKIEDTDVLAGGGADRDLEARVAALEARMAEVEGRLNEGP